MTANSIISSIVTAGANNHSTISEEANSFSTDFVTQGVVGTISNSGGIAPCVGSFGVSQDASPDMGVLVNLGVAYVSGTPSGQGTQVLRSRATANYTSYAISANASGSTKYDWIYLKLDPTNAATPSASADNVINLYTSRSTSNSSDNGTPPTYGLLLAVVTVSNGAANITNSNITDERVNAIIGTTTSIADGSITGAKLAAATVTPDKMLGIDMFAVGAAISGSAPSAGTGQFYIQAGTAVPALVAGVATINFPTPFTNGVVSVVVCQGDISKTTTEAFATKSVSKTSFTVQSGTTSAIPVRINWIAIGF